MGLKSNGNVEVLQYHPVEKFLGTFKSGAEVVITVLPFRTSLIKISTMPNPEFLLKGSAYQVVKNIPGQAVLVNLLGSPGEKINLSLFYMQGKYKKAILNGKDISSVLSGKNCQFYLSGKKERYRLPEENRQSAIELFARKS